MYKRSNNRSAVARELAICRVTINQWVASYLQSGKLIEEKKRGRPLGNGRRLTPDQEQVIQKKIIDKTPDQYKLPFALWTNAAVKRLIEQEFSIELHYLPSYSPELNPDEYLNCDLKAKFKSDTPTRKKGEMKTKMEKHMSDINPADKYLSIQSKPVCS